MSTILITGAAGNFGSYVADNVKKEYTLVRTDIRPIKDAFSKAYVADLSEYSQVESIFALEPTIHTVLHFGAKASREACWEDVLQNNIIGTKNLFEAASQAGVKRIIFASSIEAVAGYPEGVVITTSMLPRARNFYGTGKAYGETLGRYYADQYGISVLCIRFGRIFYPEDEKIGPKSMGEHYFPDPDKVITNRDALILVRKCIEAPQEIRFGVFHGLSKNTYSRLDLSDTMAILDYQPVDNAYDPAFAG